MIKKAILLTGTLCAIGMALTGCGVYAMPDDDCLHTIPTTNNPQVTRDQGMSMPSVNY